MNNKINRYFYKEEMACKCGCGHSTFDVELLEVLTNIRQTFGKPVIINSGHRCYEHNEKVGGTAMSKHLQGIAADIIVFGIEPSVVATFLEEQYPDKYGIGRYNTFTHIDVRPEKARWNSV